MILARAKIGERYQQFGCLGMREQCESFGSDHVKLDSTANGVMAVSTCRELI